MSNTPQNSFYDWYQTWQDLADFGGPNLDDEEWQRRINEIIRLWSEEPPGDWRRRLATNFKVRGLLAPGEIYRRGDDECPNTGEHQIEKDIIFNRITCFSDEYSFEPVVNAFPCAMDNIGGGRRANVEVDLLGILKVEGAIHPLICEIKTGKKGSKNPWYAAVENLRQLRLFIDNEDNLKCIKEKRGDASMTFVAPVGVVVAKPGYYTAKGQKINSMEPTRKLLKQLQAQHKDARVVLAKWCKNCKRIDRVDGCELAAAFRP
jgi:hypothetical protein